mmetsp:Transcript_12724/g.18263  ORF Transcript_12724/g.18263 Transcript_12724/m.18263 type:complete len:766 (+) Transcript_12724:91-2388(+)
MLLDSTDEHKFTNMEMEQEEGMGDINDVILSRQFEIMKNKQTCLKLSLFATAVLAVIFLFALIFTEHEGGSAATSGTIAHDPGVCLTPDCVGVAADIIRGLNQSVDPCEDFWQYSCGGWIQAHPIPDDRTSYNTFSTLSDSNDFVIKQLLADQTTTTSSSSSSSSNAVVKAKQLYTACMDEDNIDSRGAAPVQALLPALDFTSGGAGSSLSKVVGTMHRAGLSPLFNLYVGQDDRNSSRNVMYLSQSGLSLPEHSYYFPTSPATDKVLLAFTTLITKAFGLLGSTPAEAAETAQAILKFETALANVTLPRDQLRDPDKTYNVRSLAEMSQAVPHIAWDVWVSAVYTDPAQASQLTKFVVTTPSFFAGLQQALEGTDNKVLVKYLQWQQIRRSLPYLGGDFKPAYFDYKKVVRGLKGEIDRWRTCMSVTDSFFGFAVGQLFLKQKFGPTARETASKLIAEIKTSFKNRLAKLPWMDDETRTKAADKADKVVHKIGYPDWVFDATQLDSYYQELKLAGEGRYFESVQLARAWDNNRNLQDLFAAPDKGRWDMNPQEVNAYYSPSNNEMVFPAGILQPPFFGEKSPMAVNYGAIGVVMGHELTHGFDDQGARYDADGNLQPWWSQGVTERFKERTECVEKQYSKYTITGPGGNQVAVNGALTLGENIADNGGMSEAFAAYRSYTQTNGAEPRLPGLDLTPDQLFFIGFSQVWCGSLRPEDALRRQRTDPHSPHMWRVKGTVSNSEDFAQAFKCAKGTPMNPVEKCRVW